MFPFRPRGACSRPSVPARAGPVAFLAGSPGSANRRNSQTGCCGNRWFLPGLGVRGPGRRPGFCRRSWGVVLPGARSSSRFCDAAGEGKRKTCERTCSFTTGRWNLPESTRYCVQATGRTVFGVRGLRGNTAAVFAPCVCNECPCEAVQARAGSVAPVLTGVGRFRAGCASRAPAPRVRRRGSGPPPSRRAWPSSPPRRRARVRG